VTFPNSRFENVDGLEVHYLREEQTLDAGATAGAAPPGCVLHMNHGFGASSSSWSPVIGRLSSGLGALAIAHDTPGFGLTGRVGLLQANRYSLRSNAGGEIRVCTVDARVAHAIEDGLDGPSLFHSSDLNHFFYVRRRGAW